MSRTHQQTHQAGRHLAVAEALIRNYQAGLGTFTQTYVIIESVKAQVQVAAKGAWQIENVNRYINASVIINILVDMTGELRMVYVCPGDELRQQVKGRHEKFLATQGYRRPVNPLSKHAAIYPEHVEMWRNNWQLFDTLKITLPVQH